MPAKKYIKLNSSGRLEQQSATVVSGGGSNAGDIPGLDDTGRLDISVMPVGIGAETQLATATENLSEGDWVHIFNNAGVRSMRKALAADATRPADGYVINAVTLGAQDLVYTDGKNAKVALGSFVLNDLGKRVFLSPSTAGGSTITPPTTSGQLLQKVGKLVDVGDTYASVAVDFGDEIIV